MTSILCALLLSGCSVQGMLVKGKSLDSYKGTASAPEIHQVTGAYAVKGTLHNHTNLSHAALSPQELVDVARSRGIAVLGIAEHDSLQACWSRFFCFEAGSVQRMGYQAYLAQMRDLQQKNPGLVILPGLEVSPHAWWSGFPPLLTLREWDVHFTLYNLHDPDLLADMPIPGARFPRCCNYEKGGGIERYQEFVNYITRAGGVVFQAHPESFTKRTFYATRSETRPHPEYAYLLQDLTGFAALPAGKKLLEPGGLWDTALAEFLTGRRPRPLWIVGDADFHGGDQQPDSVVTWFYPAALDRISILRAMAEGKMIAAQGRPAGAVWVKQFALAAPDDPSPGRVMCGESLQDSKATTVHFALSRSIPGLSVRVIRNGSVIHSGNEPAVTVDDSAFLSTRKSAFYRVEVSGEGGFLLVTNPILRR